MPIYATHRSIFGQLWLKVLSLHFLTPARKHGPVIHKSVRQVNIMAIILFIYSSVLALGVWQDNHTRRQAETAAECNKAPRQGC
jgi:hypothetical protein